MLSHWIGKKIQRPGSACGQARLISISILTKLEEIAGHKKAGSRGQGSGIRKHPTQAKTGLVWATRPGVTRMPGGFILYRACGSRFGAGAYLAAASTPQLRQKPL